jgi:hypothetical protein
MWERIEIYTKFLLGNLKGRSYSEDQGIGGRMILELVLKKQGGKLWTGFIWLRIGTSDGLLGSIKGGDVLD